MILNRIRALCTERGVTIKELERETGIGNGVIAKWADRNPRVDTIKLVADFFGVTVDELIREEAPDAEN